MGTAVKLPLPRDFFRCPPISPKDIEHYNQLGRQISSDLVSHARLQGGAIEWKIDVDEPGLKMYSGVDLAAPTGYTTYCSVTEVAGTLDEIATLFRAESTENCRMVARHILDGHTLYKFASPTPEYPRHSVTARWFVINAPIKGLGVISHRDFCVLESHHDIDIDNRRGWVRSVKSINLDCCPSLDGVLGFVRASFFRSGHIVMETDRPGILQVTHLIQLNLRLHTPQWMLHVGIRARCRDVLNLDLSLRELRLSYGSFLASDELIPKESRSACPLCYKSFGLLAHKKNCRKCGEVVCRGCSKTWNVVLMGSSMPLRICTSCAVSTTTLLSRTTSCSSSSSQTSSSPASRISSRSVDQIACGRFILERDPVIRVRATKVDDDTIPMLEASLVHHKTQYSTDQHNDSRRVCYIGNEDDSDDDDAGWSI